MKNKRRYILIILCLIFLIMSCASTGVRDLRTLKTKVADNLAKFPAENAAARDIIASELIALGAPGIKEICSLLVPPGTGDDTKIRYALSGLSAYVHRPGAEKERKMYSGAIVEAMNSAADNEIKAFLIRQLQLAGGDEAVSPLGALLGHTRLGEPAAQALLSIRTPAVENEFVKALPNAQGKNKVTVIKALGELRSKKALKTLQGLSTDPDPQVKEVSLYALGLCYSYK